MESHQSNGNKDQLDLIVIGGGITGAGVFREAVRKGYKTLLVEQKDFSWGTSSRSSKMVHGGLRYMAQGKFLLTMTSVREREKLLREAPGLVETLEILVPVYSDQKPGKHALSLGLSIYGLMALEKQHTYFDRDEFLALVPDLKRPDLVGGFQFLDAQVDDSRLVLRLIHEGIAAGGRALNYTRVTEIQRDADGMVSGVRVLDAETKQEKLYATGAVINATGSWAEEFHPSPKTGLHLRPLRGSHLITARDALPIDQTISFLHPDDKRPVFATLWEGSIMIGTTDLDHDQDLLMEPFATREEVEYLLDGINAYFPDHKLTAEDCISTWAGVRPVLSEGKLDPSKESRENVVWSDRGLVTVTGGKLTTFRKMAFDTLKTAAEFLPKPENKVEHEPVFDAVDPLPESRQGLSQAVIRRLYGRYGAAAAEILDTTAEDVLTEIPGTHTLWAEIPFAARHENVRHLEDLLLRRVRIGLLVSEGGKAYLDKIQKLCQSILPWDEKRWEEEKKAYMTLWRSAYSVPKTD